MSLDWVKIPSVETRLAARKFSRREREMKLPYFFLAGLSGDPPSSPIAFILRWPFVSSACYYSNCDEGIVPPDPGVP